MSSCARRLPPTPEAIEQAGKILRAGGLVAFPTETVYGLGADAGNDRAVASIFAAKRRPEFNPLIVHVLDQAAAEALAILDGRARRLIRRFWPGALTLVLPRRADARLSRLVSAGLPTVALRSPAHPIARRILGAAAIPIAAPSANLSGRLSATNADHVARDLADAIDLIIDGGPCPIGLESTIVDLSGPRPVLLRPGGVDREAIAAELGPVADPEDGMVKAPGMMSSHYAPHLKLRLNTRKPRADEALLAFGADVPEGAAVTLNLSATSDLVEAAANLFAMLDALDRPQLAAIAVMPVPEIGLGLAINDRLRRAAAPRPQNR